ncbi:hypothetical protein BpHYR1_010799 [Brachionus plicatilis]|uniref:Uncharacterized protein n=1 Tax=Brachionus plicatilis TaxID=10195 RepID=A0A3M7QVH9_BRAPC|nr:hypothetical protein BpHYR1_010799 [Brachionus plicatilis]
MYRCFYNKHYTFMERLSEEYKISDQFLRMAKMKILLIDLYVHPLYSFLISIENFIMRLKFLIINWHQNDRCI